MTKIGYIMPSVNKIRDIVLIVQGTNNCNDGNLFFIAFCDKSNGDILYKSFIKTDSPISGKSTHFSHIDNDFLNSSVSHAKDWCDVFNDIKSFFVPGNVIYCYQKNTFNISRMFITQTCIKHKMSYDFLKNVKFKQIAYHEICREEVNKYLYEQAHLFDANRVTHKTYVKYGEFPKKTISPVGYNELLKPALMTFAGLFLFIAGANYVSISLTGINIFDYVDTFLGN